MITFLIHVHNPYAPSLLSERAYKNLREAKHVMVQFNFWPRVESVYKAYQTLLKKAAPLYVRGPRWCGLVATILDLLCSIVLLASKYYHWFVDVMGVKLEQLLSQVFVG